MNRHAAAIELQMTSMIDVVFLLLVFFLWTASFEQPEHDLSGAMAMPPLGTAAAIASDLSPPPFDEIIIRLTQPSGSADAEIWLNDRVLSGAGELAERLRAIAALGAGPPVILVPDASVSMGQAIAVYDAIRAAGFDRVMFAVEP